MDIALVSCVHCPWPDPDEAPLDGALARAGLRARVVGWDDPEFDWSSTRIAVLRSTWNYPEHWREFIAWAERAATRTALWNRPDAVRWNAHKGYLLDLEQRGVPIVPTALIEPRATIALPDLLDERGWDRVVIKPAVSAGSVGTRLFDRSALDAAQAHLAALLAHGDVLVQPFVTSVDSYGERALIWIDGALTHAVRKNPRFDGDDEFVSPAAIEISQDEAALVERTLAAVARCIADEPLLYARIDMAPGPVGAPMLMELELIEPSLYFDQSPEALDRFVSALDRRVAAF